ncbi:MAG: hypothetical protein LBS46_01855 [Dysgonamonadaceae bacterium]|nr:hypothetical protein [Dysgonamonadaceae bacterium]
MCKYLTDQNNGVPPGNWVMPTGADFTSASMSAWTGTAPSSGTYWYREPQNGGFTSDNTQTGTNTDGTYHGWDWGASYFGSTTVFPASGYRSNSGGLRDTGNYGYYWSSSVTDNTFVYYFNFNSTGVITSNAGRGYAFSVRCVLQH